MFLTVSELNTHLYGEIITEITRFTPGSGQTANDNDIAKKAIKTGEAEVKSYLSAYDIETLFSAGGDDRDEHLLSIVKDVATWRLICLANPNVEMSLREKLYDDAISFLTKVQSGKAVPAWPYKPSDTSDSGYAQNIKYGSNTKRSNQY